MTKILMLCAVPSIVGPKKGGPAIGVTSILGALLLASCGVQDSQHDQGTVDPNKDLGGTTTAGTTSGATTGSTTSASTGATTGGASTGATTGGATTGGATTGSAGSASSGNTTSGPTTGSTTAGMTDAQAGGTGGAPNDRPDASAEAGPLSGITTNIGGVNVPKENIIAFIHLGHSNMAGRATGPASEAPYDLTQIDPHAWMYHVGKPIQPALEPGTAGDNGCTNCGGPGTPLLKQAAALAPGKYFVSLGFGFGSAYCTQFLPGALYYDALIAAPKAMKGRCTFGAIVIMLGITERHGTADDINGYATCINQLVTAIRTDVGEPNLPLLITDYEANATGLLAPNQAFPMSIIPQIRKIPSVVSNSALVPTDGLAMEDDHHFNFLGQRVWTGRVLQIMKDKGWSPWAP